MKVNFTTPKEKLEDRISKPTQLFSWEPFTPSEKHEPSCCLLVLPLRARGWLASLYSDESGKEFGRARPTPRCWWGSFLELYLKWKSYILQERNDTRRWTSWECYQPSPVLSSMLSISRRMRLYVWDGIVGCVGVPANGKGLSWTPKIILPLLVCLKKILGNRQGLSKQGEDRIRSCKRHRHFPW